MYRKTLIELAGVPPTRTRLSSKAVRRIGSLAPRAKKAGKTAAPDESEFADEALGEAEHLGGLDEHHAALDGADVDVDDVGGVREITEIAEIAEDGEKAAAGEVPSNFLAVYFKEMAQLSVLKPDQEYEIAKRIGGLELELWVRLLSLAPLTDYLLRVVERTIDNSLPEFRVLRTAAEATLASGQLTDEELVKVANQVAEKLRKLDIDRVYVAVALGEVKKLATGADGLIINDHQNGHQKLDINVKGKPFRQYLRDLGLTLRRVQRAKNDFVKANLRLVVSIARRFNHGRMPLADIIQEGNIGLIKAVERFDYRRGYRFSTYASWWIRHAISRGLADKGRAVRLPVHMIDVYHRVSRSKRELSGKLGRQPTTEELGDATGLALHKIEKMRSYLLDQCFSLDRAVSDKDGRKFIDFIQDESAASRPTEQLVGAAMTSEVRRVLSDLKPIEADILRQRFGLDTDEEMTLKQIGEKYNLSRERIRQLQEQALFKMRRALVRRDLR